MVQIAQLPPWICETCHQSNPGSADTCLNCLENLGHLHIRMGEHETARRELETSLAIHGALGNQFGIAKAHAGLAELAAIQGRFPDALAHVEAAQRLADILQSSEVQVYLAWVLALVEAELGDLPVALITAEQALVLARAGGYVEGEIDCLRVLGRLNAQAGRRREAKELLRQSAGLAEAQADPYRRGLALLETGRLYQAALNQAPATAAAGWARGEAALNQASQLFESLGAAYDLQAARTALEWFKGNRSSSDH